jgi:hypothetical protein
MPQIILSIQPSGVTFSVTALFLDQLYMGSFFTFRSYGKVISYLL